MSLHGTLTCALALAVVGIGCSARGVETTGATAPGNQLGAGLRACTIGPVVLDADTVIRQGTTIVPDWLPISTGRGPQYPDEARRTGLEGSVRVSYTVDTSGAVVPRSVVIVRETDRQFGDAVCAFMMRLRFPPFVANNRKYRVRIDSQPFNFTLHY